MLVVGGWLLNSGGAAACPRHGYGVDDRVSLIDRSMSPHTRILLQSFDTARSHTDRCYYFDVYQLMNNCKMDYIIDIINLVDISTLVIIMAFIPISS